LLKKQLAQFRKLTEQDKDSNKIQEGYVSFGCFQAICRIESSANEKVKQVVSAIPADTNMHKNDRLLILTYEPLTHKNRNICTGH